VISSIKIINQFGIVVYSSRVNDHKARLIIDLSKGVYFLKVQFAGSGKSVSRKVFIN